MYKHMVNIIQIMTNLSHVLLQSLGSVQHTIRLYNLVCYNVIPLNPAHVEIFCWVTQLLIHYIFPITLEWKVQSGIHFSQFTPILK